MMRRIILLTLLISSVRALNIHRVEFNINELDHLNDLDQIPDEIQVEQLPGVCWACKWAMRNVRHHLSNNATKSEIKGLLASVCDNIGFLRFVCRPLINKFMDILIEELSTNDNPQTICANIGVC